MRRVLILVAVGALWGCFDGSRPAVTRASVKRVEGTTFEVIPADGQYPYCLVFTLSSGGVIRQLTMSRENVSYPCPAGRPIGGHSYRAPLDEGAVKVQVLFTSQKVNAASVAQQLLDLRERPQIASIDLRLPGNAAIETLAFAPETDAAPTVGGVVGRDGVPDADAGNP